MQVASTLAAAVASFFALACASHQTGAHSVALTEGTYRVVSRTCDGEEVELATCNRIRYVEIVRGKFYGVSDEELAIVQWVALDAESGPYTYNARRLRGYAQDNRYVIDELDQPSFEVREWFVLQAGQPQTYRFRKQSKVGAGGSTAEFALELSPAPRDAALAERIPYPSPTIDVADEQDALAQPINER